MLYTKDVLNWKTGRWQEKSRKNTEIYISWKSQAVKNDVEILISNNVDFLHIYIFSKTYLRKKWVVKSTFGVSI